MDNEEQMEAAEIDAKPRLVITTDSFYIAPKTGQRLVLKQNELLAVAKLQEALERNDDPQDRV